MLDQLEQIIREYESRFGLQNFMFPLDMRLAKLLQSITGEDQSAGTVDFDKMRDQVSEAENEIDSARFSLSMAEDELYNIKKTLDALIPRVKA